MKLDAIVTVVQNCLKGRQCGIIWEDYSIKLDVFVWKDGGVELFIWEEVYYEQVPSIVVGSYSLSRVRRSFSRVIGTFTLFRNKVRRVTVVQNYLKGRYRIIQKDGV